MPSKYSLHRQQLFHWIGDKIDASNLTPKAKAEKYVQYLADSLKDGLWVKSPKQDEVIRLGEQKHTLELPMVCFTEWALGQSHDHAKQYGHLGLGFSRRWVMSKQGQPVTYYRTDKQSRFIKTLFNLINARDQLNAKSVKALEYLIHFTKPARVSKKVDKDKPKSKKPKDSPGKKKAAPLTKKRFGGPMKFMEEREWRIVRQEGAKIFDENTKGKRPPYHLKYKPGHDLFTVVLPNNLTVSRVMQSTELCKMLFPKDAPQVSIVSLEDIGTY